MSDNFTTRENIHDIKDLLHLLSNKSMTVRNNTSWLEDDIIDVSEYKEYIQELHWILDDIDDIVNHMAS